MQLCIHCAQSYCLFWREIEICHILGSICQKANKLNAVVSVTPCMKLSKRLVQMKHLLMANSIIVLVECFVGRGALKRLSLELTFWGSDFWFPFCENALKYWYPLVTRIRNTCFRWHYLFIYVLFQISW